MQTVFYFLKRFVNFIEVDVLLLKSISKFKSVLCFLFLYSILILHFFLENRYPQINIMTIYYIAQWIMFVYFFSKLKNNNFFNHLALNRGFFRLSTEILLFLISILAIFVAMNLFIFFTGFNTAKVFVLSSFSLVVDALLFVHWKFWKYLLFQLFVLLNVLFSFCIANGTYTVNLVDFFQNIMHFNATTTIFVVLIEMMIILKLFKNDNN